MSFIFALAALLLVMQLLHLETQLLLFPISTAQHSSPAQLQHARSLARSHLKSEKLDIATALVCGIKILQSMEMASQSTFLSFKPSFIRASSLN